MPVACNLATCEIKGFSIVLRVAKLKCAHLYQERKRMGTDCQLQCNRARVKFAYDPGRRSIFKRRNKTA